jgi:hypothetical protein
MEIIGEEGKMKIYTSMVISPFSTVTIEERTGFFE